MIKIAVIGSVSVDLVTTSEKRPNKGETIIGTSFSTFFGGKGANQAVSASRLGANVWMIGAVGDDTYGHNIINNLKENNIDTSYMKIVENTSSGVATITIAENDNSIIVVPGANYCLEKEDIDNSIPLIKEMDVVILQQEIPVKTNEYALKVCKELGVMTILNPAPVDVNSKNLVNLATYITPNEHEYKLLFENISTQQLEKDIQEKLIITEGENGASYFINGEKKTVATLKAKVVDTTGAGDTFNGALGVKLASKASLEDAIFFANASASLSVRKMGAQGGMPFSKDVEKFIKTI